VLETSTSWKPLSSAGLKQVVRLHFWLVSVFASTSEFPLNAGSGTQLWKNSRPSEEFAPSMPSYSSWTLTQLNEWCCVIVVVSLRHCFVLNCHHSSTFFLDKQDVHNTIEGRLFITLHVLLFLHLHPLAIFQLCHKLIPTRLYQVASKLWKFMPRLELYSPMQRSKSLYPTWSWLHHQLCLAGLEERYIQWCCSQSDS
jgi:hypothetical protein